MSLLKSVEAFSIDLVTSSIRSNNLTMRAFRFSLEYNRTELRYTMCIGDSDKLNLIWWFDFRLRQILATAPADSKILLTSKVVKSDP